MIYLFYGEDQFTLREEVDKLVTGNLPPEALDFNFSKIDAARSGFNLDEVFNTADAFPFLSDKRVVLVNGLFSKLGKGEEEGGEAPPPKPAPKSAKARGAALQPASNRDRMVDFAGRVPESTILILVESKVAKNDSLFKAIQKHGQVKEFLPPKDVHLDKWVTDRARKNGYKLDPRASTLLAHYIGSDLWRIENELHKLAAYAGEGQTITVEMVEKLCVEVRDTPIYRLTEALAKKDLREALVQLNRLRSETALARPGFARYVFNGITRQVVDLVKIRELAANRQSSDEIAAQLRIHPFVAKKNVELSRNFSAARLDWLYHRLTELDYADKTGKADLPSELDLLLVEICNK